MAEIEFGMEKAQLKQLLLRSKKDPVNCAMGKGAGANGVFLRLDKIKQARKISNELKDEFGDIKDLRWGTAFVDTDVNPKLVEFRINKPAQGLGKRLIKVVRLVGFSKVRFVFEDGSEAEEEADEEEDESAGAPVQEAPQLDAAALKERLTALVRLIPQALTKEPARKGEFLGLAKQGQTQIESGDLSAALKTIEDLDFALQAVADTKVDVAADTKANAGAVAYGKSRLAWIAVHRQVTSDVEKLRAAIEDEYSDAPQGREISTKYKQVVDPLLSRLDDELADYLDDAANASDPEKRVELIEKARAKIKDYQGVIETETFFKELDGNPFVPLTTTAMLTKTLATLSAALR